MVEMHLMAPLHLTQLALPSVRERGRGWVLNLTSVAGYLIAGPPFPDFDRGAGLGMYGTCKAAQSPHTRLGRRALRRRHRRERRGAEESRGDSGCRNTRLDKGEHCGHRVDHGNDVPPVQGDPRVLTGRVVKTQAFLRAVGLQPRRP